MRAWRRSLCLGVAAWLAAPAAADVLALRDGRRLEGRLTAVRGQQLHFETAAGLVAVPIADAAALHFAPPGAAATPPGPGAASARPLAPEGRAVQVPAGTRVRVRIRDTLDPRQGVEGDRFTAHLEAPISAGGRVLVPARTVVYGVVTSARPTGPVQQQLRLALEALQIEGRRLAIATGPQARVGEAPGDAPAQRASDADARLPAGALLEFRLLQPLAIPPAPR